MNKILVYFLLLILAGGCNNKSVRQPATANASDTTVQEFFPVTSFLKGQLVPMDSMQVTPLKITIKSGKEDSSWITVPALKTALEDFTSFEINSTNLLPFFNEAKFKDESTDAITFTYQPKGKLPDSISIRNWDVYINPETGTIKRVYVVRQLTQNGAGYIQQLTWQTDKSARITTIHNISGGGSEITNDVKLIWGF